MNPSPQISDSFLNYSLTSQDRLAWEELLSDAPDCISVGEILSQWQMAKRHFAISNRELPLPVWRQRRFDHDGNRAWHELSSGFVSETSADPISIYIHIPFCDRRCGFCDCYSMPLGKASTDIEGSYVNALLGEMETWRSVRQIDNRPVTTVHFGGGTPSCIGEAHFGSIVRQCRACYTTTDRTEFALELTTSLLDDKHLDALHGWGFSRLHIGVQTLEDEARLLIGRKEDSATVLKKLERAIQLGFTVSTDILLGLPGQTISGFLGTLSRLVEVGVHGFSLYQLQMSRRNRKFIERVGGKDRGTLFEYLLFQLAEQYLTSHNFRKNHFDHFSLPEDRNLYCTHASRKEDLLALGTTADGAFGYYHYRHPAIKQYISKTEVGLPALEGGMSESSFEKRVRPGVVSLMVARISDATFHDFDAVALRDAWLECLLLKADPQSDEFSLTANGSWFINEMIEQFKNGVLRDTSIH